MNISKFIQSLSKKEIQELYAELVRLDSDEKHILIEDFIDVMHIRIKHDKYPSIPYTSMSSRLCNALQRIIAGDYYTGYIDAKLYGLPGNIRYLSEFEPYINRISQIGTKSIEEYFLLKEEFLKLWKEMKDY